MQEKLTLLTRILAECNLLIFVSWNICSVFDGVTISEVKKKNHGVFGKEMFPSFIKINEKCPKI